MHVYIHICVYVDDPYKSTDVHYIYVYMYLNTCMAHAGMGLLADPERHFGC